MARYCSNCGTALKDDQTFCPNCGTRASAPEASTSGSFNQPFTPPVSDQGQGFVPPVYSYGSQGGGFKCTTKKEFLALPENKKIRSQIRSSGIICYICGGITLVVALIFMSLMTLLDVALVVGLGLGVHLAQSRVCAILLTVYAAFSVIVGIVVNGTVSGWLLVIAAVVSIISTFNLEKAWKAYQQQP